MTAGAFKLEDLEEEMHLLQAKLVAIGQKKMALLDADLSTKCLVRTRSGRPRMHDSADG